MSEQLQQNIPPPWLTATPFPYFAMHVTIWDVCYISEYSAGLEVAGLKKYGALRKIFSVFSQKLVMSCLT
jgi:hypothetical protein